MHLREESRFHAPPPSAPDWRLSSMAFPARRGLSQRWRADEPIVRRPVPEFGRHRHPVPSVARWLDRLYRLCDDRKRGPAVDLVLDAFDDLLFLQDTARCDEILRTADVERLMSEVLLAILMETFRARSALGERDGFYGRVEERLTRERPEKVGALLGGMK
jgi:hypothetical protein